MRNHLRFRGLGKYEIFFDFGQIFVNFELTLDNYKVNQ